MTGLAKLSAGGDMWIVNAWYGSAPELPPDVVLSPGGHFQWADVDGDGLDDLLLVALYVGVVQIWPSSRPAAEPELWFPPDPCGYPGLAVEPSKGPGDPILLAASGQRGDGWWLTQFALEPGAAAPVFQWEARVEDGAAPPTAGYVGDVDGDGVSDLFAFTAGDAGSVRLSRTGLWQPLPMPIHAWDTNPVHRVDDLDGDGFADLVVLTGQVRKTDGGWGSLVHSLILLQGGADGLSAEPLWEIGYREDPTVERWESPGFGVVRLENAAGEPRLALSWTTRMDTATKSIGFRSIDVLGEVGTTAPAVLQTVSPSGWSISSSWDLSMMRMDTADGSSVVVGTDSMAAWFAWDPLEDRLSPSPDAMNSLVNSAPFGAQPGPYAANYSDPSDSDIYAVWGWSLLGGIVPTPLGQGDPRLVDCDPAPADTGVDPVVLPPEDPPAADRSASSSSPTSCGCGAAPASAMPAFAVLAALAALGRRRRAP